MTCSGVAYQDGTYIVNGSLGAHLDGPWIATNGFGSIVFHAHWAAAGTSYGVFKIQGANSQSAAAADLATVAAGGSLTVDTSVAAARLLTAAHFGATNGVPLPAFVRLRFEYSSGSGGQLQAGVIGR